MGQLRESWGKEDRETGMVLRDRKFWILSSEIAFGMAMAFMSSD
jgi:hypothetical protein